MARFKYLGEPARTGLVKKYGPCTEIIVPQKNGTRVSLTPVPPNTEFVVDQDIGYDITDSQAVRSLKYNSRFEEIV